MLLRVRERGMEPFMEPPCESSMSLALIDAWLALQIEETESEANNDGKEKPVPVLQTDGPAGLQQRKKVRLFFFLFFHFFKFHSEWCMQREKVARDEDSNASRKESRGLKT